jgi:hypothetical protein
MQHKHVIIYLTDGSTTQYCTKDLGDSYVQVVDTIQCEPTLVNIAYKEDKKVVGVSYVGLPYRLEIF